MRRLLFLVWCSFACAGTLAPGDALPACELVNEQGKAVRLSDFKGRAVALTFIFTRCPLPDYCPRLSAALAAAQRELSKSRPAGGWHLLSLSFDPQHDTPERLAAYATGLGADPARWTFATGAPGVVSGLGAHVGLEVSNVGGLLNHNLRTVVVDAAGRVQHVFKGSDWTAADLVWEMRKAMPAQPLENIK